MPDLSDSEKGAAISHSLKTILLGKKQGNFRIGTGTDSIPAIGAAVDAHIAVRGIHILRLQGGTHIAHASGISSAPISWVCDGLIVRDQSVAVAMPLADCLAICLITPSGALAILHGGYRCMVPSDGRSGIIERALASDDFTDRSTIHGFISSGIGACCYAADHWQEVRQHSDRISAYVRTTTRGPLRGRRSLDLYQLAHDSLVSAGIPANNITVDSTCTSCARIHGMYTYWSHTRAKAEHREKDEGRNLFIAYIA